MRIRGADMRSLLFTVNENFVDDSSKADNNARVPGCGMDRSCFTVPDKTETNGRGSRNGETYEQH